MQKSKSPRKSIAQIFQNRQRIVTQKYAEEEEVETNRKDEVTEEKAGPTSNIRKAHTNKHLKEIAHIWKDRFQTKVTTRNSISM